MNIEAISKQNSTVQAPTQPPKKKGYDDVEISDVTDEDEKDKKDKKKDGSVQAKVDSKDPVSKVTEKPGGGTPRTLRAAGPTNPQKQAETPAKKKCCVIL